MTVLQSIVLGIVQGLTEFLPISSSGHLVFIPKIFGWVDQGIGFDVMVHLGSLLAVIIYFRKLLWKILKSFFIKNEPLPNPPLRGEGTNYRRLGWLIILTIIPAGVVGLLFGDWIETNLRSSMVIGIGLIFWGLVLYIAERYQCRSQITDHRSLKNIGWRNALFIGCAQAIALIPGTSRSGITMTAGLFSKLDKKSAAEFSFLMSVPIIMLAGGLNLLELIQKGLGDLNLVVLVAGFVAAAVSGFVAIAGLMKIIQKWSFKPFVLYRIVVGIIILFFLK